MMSRRRLRTALTIVLCWMAGTSGAWGSDSERPGPTTGLATEPADALVPDEIPPSGFHFLQEFNGAGTLASWFASGTLAWGTDSNGCAASGSAQVTAFDAGGFFLAELESPCFPVTAGEPLVLAVSLINPVSIYSPYVDFYSDVDCTTFVSVPSVVFSPSIPVAADWQRAVRQSTVIPTGQGIVAATLGFSLSRGTAFTFSIDRLSVSRSNPVFLDDLEAGSECRWSLLGP